MALIGSGIDHEVDPISRIEGHLGVKVRVNAGTIVDANAHGNLWRGFENFLLGRDINDAITFTQRICGVCPVPHGMTSTYATDTVLGYSRGHITFAFDGTYGVPAKAVLIRNLVLSAEFLMSSITHFYHLAAPSYVQGPAIPPWTPYFNDNFYHAALLSASAGSGAVKAGGQGVVPDSNAGTMQLWDAVIISYVRALKIRRLTFEAASVFAGRMPMTSCYVGGGVTNDGTQDLTARCNQFETLIKEVALFIVNEYVPIAMALGVLYQPFDSQTMDASGVHTMKAGNRGYGAGLGRFLAWGAFPSADATGALALPGGFYDAASPGTAWTAANKAQIYSQFVDPASPNYVGKMLTEDIANSRYEVYVDDTAAYATSGTRPNASATAAYPGDVTRTKPVRDNGYTYMKAPRWGGQACEVGPLARLAVAGYYPVDGRTLASVVPGYATYVNGSGGLDTRIIAPTIVAALGNMGLVGTVQSWVLGLKGGLSTMDRLRARALESLVLVQAMVGSVSKDQGTGVLSFANNGWIHQLKAMTGGVLDTAGSTRRSLSIPAGTRQGWGATEAPRGALMHQATINNGKITAYQCIVPTTWNGSPKDVAGNNGAIESACIGAPFNTTDTKTITSQDGVTPITSTGGVEVLRIAQSFDPCIACAVH
jgi:Ni,Fe-hydrogenase I large subunit